MESSRYPRRSTPFGAPSYTTRKNFWPNISCLVTNLTDWRSLPSVLPTLLKDHCRWPWLDSIVGRPKLTWFLDAQERSEFLRTGLCEVVGELPDEELLVLALLTFGNSSQLTCFRIRFRLMVWSTGCRRVESRILVTTVIALTCDIRLPSPRWASLGLIPLFPGTTVSCNLPQIGCSIPCRILWFWGDLTCVRRMQGRASGCPLPSLEWWNPEFVLPQKCNTRLPNSWWASLDSSRCFLGPQCVEIYLESIVACEIECSDPEETLPAFEGYTVEYLSVSVTIVHTFPHSSVPAFIILLLINKWFSKSGNSIA